MTANPTRLETYIKGVLAREGMSLVAFGNRLGWSAASVTRKLKGQRSIGSVETFKLAEVLNNELGEFISPSAVLTMVNNARIQFQKERNQ